MELLSKNFKETTIYFSMLSKGLGDIEPALLVIGGDVAVIFPLDVNLAFNDIVIHAVDKIQLLAYIVKALDFKLTLADHILYFQHGALLYDIIIRCRTLHGIIVFNDYGIIRAVTPSTANWQVAQRLPEHVSWRKRKRQER